MSQLEKKQNINETYEMGCGRRTTVRHNYRTCTTFEDNRQDKISDDELANSEDHNIDINETYVLKLASIDEAKEVLSNQKKS